MKARTIEQPLKGSLWAVLFAGCFAIVTEPAFAEEPAETPAPTTEAESGMIVYFDPETGEILPGPAPDAGRLVFDRQTQQALSTSHEGLVATPSPVPGGGVMLDLQGRFQNPLIAVTDAEGNIVMHHLHEAPPVPAE